LLGEKYEAQNLSPINIQKRCNNHFAILYTGVFVFQEFALDGWVSLAERDAGDIYDL